MKKGIVLLSAIFICFVVSVKPSLAFDMARYWPIKAGIVLIYDRDFFVVGSKTYAFANFKGIQVITGMLFRDGRYSYLYSGPDGILLLGQYRSHQLIDISDVPIKFASADMKINDKIITTIPAGRVDNDPLTFTVTLLTQETVTVPTGQFSTLVLQIRVDDSPISHYVEKVWLAEGIGPVKFQRVSESPLNRNGCLFTCGSFDDNGNIVQREISLESSLGLPLVDINNDGKVGMEEAIYILQVLSNQR
jgi:hypothetical protein